MNHKKNLFQHLSVRFSLGFIALAALTLTACNKEEVKTTPAPVAVQAVKVEPQTVPVKASFVAQVESSHQVDIVARVNGFLDKSHYTEGAVVKKGQTLFLMDQKPFIAQVEAARGAMANNEAQLWTAQANLNCVQPLAELDVASKSDLDNAIGVVSVEAIAAAFLIIEVEGKTIVADGVATCRTIVATGKMIYRTLARKGVKTGRTTEMMCEMIGVTGITIVIVTGLAQV